MRLEVVRLGDPRVAPLLAGLEAEYLARYGPSEEMTRVGEGDFDPPAGLFVVAVDGAVTAAGGGFRGHEEGVCEVKRMWTAPAYRRQGLAEQVLDFLERAARAAGYRRLVLETGPRQGEAVALYDKRGYGRIAAFGPYPEAVAFGLELTAGGGTAR
ncbi:MAG TPA: GNAT family N-acetyltransferase [Acidimicrobiales bacterium]|nr:GNAT family N-acetyltransferase [Acidimicrobiales bacterium]